MDETSKLSPAENLALIAEVFSRTRENIKEHCSLFIVWGWAMPIASIAGFALRQANIKYFFVPFPVCAAIGIALTIRHFKIVRWQSETYLGSFIKNLWICIAFGFVSMVSMSLYQKVSPFAYTMVLGAVGTMVTGLSMRFNPMVAGGGILFFGAVLCLFVPIEYKIVINGIVTLLGYLVPGYILKNRTI